MATVLYCDVIMKPSVLLIEHSGVVLGHHDVKFSIVTIELVMSKDGIVVATRIVMSQFITGVGPPSIVLKKA